MVCFVHNLEEGTMPLNIKSEETHRAAKHLAQLRGTTLTKAVSQALHEAIDRSGKTGQRDMDKIRAEVKAIQDRVAALPELSELSGHEIEQELYGDDGLPK